MVTVNLLTNPESPNKAHFRPTVTEESEKSTMFIFIAVTALFYDGHGEDIRALNDIETEYLSIEQCLEFCSRTI